MIGKFFKIIIRNFSLQNAFIPKFKFFKTREIILFRRGIRSQAHFFARLRIWICENLFRPCTRLTIVPAAKRRTSSFGGFVFFSEYKQG